MMATENGFSLKSGFTKIFPTPNIPPMFFFFTWGKCHLVAFTTITEKIGSRKSADKVVKLRFLEFGHFQRNSAMTSLKYFNAQMDKERV